MRVAESPEVAARQPAGKYGEGSRPQSLRALRVVLLSSGTFRHVRGYLDFLRDRGHEVHWITFTPPAWRPEGVVLHDVSKVHDPFSGRVAKLRYLRSIPSVRRVLRDVKPDILHGHYVTSAGVLCLFSGFRPYVVSARGTDLIGSMRSPLWRVLLRRVFSRAALVHAVSDELSALAERLGVPRNGCLTLSQGIDTTVFRYCPRFRDGGPVGLICTRHLHETYDVATIVKACGLLKDRGVSFRLTLAGAGPLGHQLRQMVESLGIGDAVQFLGGYDNADLPALLSGHDLYLSSSLWDGTSISLLEAMACGIFPVVSRIPSNEAWVRDGETALMFECGDAQMLARQIERAALDEKLVRRAVEINRRTVEERGDRQKNMLLLENNYYEVLADGDLGERA